MRRIALSAALVMLAACKQEADDPTPAQEVLRPAANMPQPGRYRVTMKVSAVSFPGMSGRTAEQTRALFGGTGQVSEFCLTPQEAAKGQEAYFRQLAQGDCRFDRFAAKDGKIDAVLTCQTGQGMRARTEMTGTFTPAASQVAIRTTSEVPGGPANGPGGGMVLDAEVATERLGECI